MARSVSLSDNAFRVLRREKRPLESDSDVVLRLALQARSREERLQAFLRNPPEPEPDWETHEDFLERMRQVDRRRMRDDTAHG